MLLFMSHSPWSELLTPTRAHQEEKESRPVDPRGLCSMKHLLSLVYSVPLSWAYTDSPSSHGP